ncbi:hypothetical protein Pint_10653 [Pistacia integerrima]|uniref:Uncharacterized protein n=1 Tax=Pistacia integerrima TaxID=434235 RepID=A0ACC0XHM7_9ROSI|nr:hypothetical protein Pint_10653 [Pistacia integerrima]
MDSNGNDQQQEGAFIKNGSKKKYVIACAIFASLNSVLLGYACPNHSADVGVMSGAIIFMKEDLKMSEVQQEVLVGILSIISLLGSLAGGKTSDVLGRKWTIALAAIVFQSAEISPSVARGSLTSFPEIFINFGILLGCISNFAFSGLPVHINWRIMLGAGILPSIFMGCALFVIPESPRWLVMQQRVDEARVVLSKTNESEREVEERLAEIQEAAGIANAENYEGKAVWREMINPTPAVKRMLITGCGIQCFQQITGIDATVYYSPTIFKNAGIKTDSELLAATVAVGFTKTMFILLAIILIDKVGRKPLLYVSTIGITICLLGLSLTLTFMGNGQLGIGLAILSVCGNVAFFSIGIGTICWVLSSEVFPLRLRAQASALGAVGSRVSSGVIAMTFLSVSHAITVGGTFCVFALISALSVAFVYKCVPETKGKSLEQIEMLFQNEGNRHGEVQVGVEQPVLR